MQHLLTLEGLPVTVIDRILDTALPFVSIAERDVKKVPLLRGKTVFNLFFENSTRTRTTFEIAAKRLSADVINLNIGVSSTSKGETLLDTIDNLVAMNADMFVVRHAQSGAAHLIAQHLSAADRPHIHVINAGDGRHAHPTQGLLDLFTIRHYKKDFHGLTVAIVGDLLHSRVARSLIHGLTTLGTTEVRVIGPQTLLPAAVESMGVRVFHDMRAGLAGADVVVMLRLQSERMKGALLPSAGEYFKHYGLTAENSRWPSRRDRHAPGTDESRRRDRLVGCRRRAFGDPAAGDVRHRRADGGDEHAGGQLSSATTVTATNVEIRNGRLIDPRHGVDGKTSLFVAAGRVAGRRPARRLARRQNHRCGRMRHLPGPDRPRRACAS